MIGVIGLELLRDYAALKAEERKEKALKAVKMVHKYNQCVWGSWAGNKFVCMFAHCVKLEGFKK